MREDLITVLKAQQWEICKGHLNALWALSGAVALLQIESQYLKMCNLRLSNLLKISKGMVCTNEH